MWYIGIFLGSLRSEETCQECEKREGGFESARAQREDGKRTSATLGDKCQWQEAAAAVGSWEKKIKTATPEHQVKSRNTTASTTAIAAWLLITMNQNRTFDIPCNEHDSALFKTTVVMTAELGFTRQKYYQILHARYTAVPKCGETKSEPSPRRDMAITICFPLYRCYHEGMTIGVGFVAIWILYHWRSSALALRAATVGTTVQEHIALFALLVKQWTGPSSVHQPYVG